VQCGDPNINRDDVPEPGESDLVKLQGLIPPAITPLTPDGAVDTAAVHRLTEHLVAGGVDGIFILGTSGEGPSLTRKKRQQVAAEFVRAAARRVPVLAGAAETSAERGEEAIDDLSDAGVDVVVLNTPYHLAGVGDRAVLAHLQRLAGYSSLPTVIYNIPVNTNNPVSPAVLDDVASLPGVIGLKDSSDDWDSFEAMLRVGHRHGIAVLQGSERLVARSILAGADGAVPGIANLVPALAARLITTSRAGDESSAMAMQARFDAVCALQTSGFWLACLKAAASRLELCTPTLASGMPGLTDAEAARLERFLATAEREARTHE
jgi:4-hydroxy-tetrahydrodipicolinate synthase